MEVSLLAATEVLPEPALYGLLASLVGGLFALVRWVLMEYLTRAKRIEEENKRLYTYMADQMIPALIKVSEAVDKAHDLVLLMERRRRS